MLFRGAIANLSYFLHYGEKVKQPPGFENFMLTSPLTNFGVCLHTVD